MIVLGLLLYNSVPKSEMYSLGQKTFLKHAHNSDHAQSKAGCWFIFGLNVYWFAGYCSTSALNNKHPEDGIPNESAPRRKGILQFVWMRLAREKGDNVSSWNAHDTLTAVHCSCV